MDFTTPFIRWLLQSDYIKENKLFLNAVTAQDSSLQIITQQVAENQIKRYVDGSKSYPISFSIANFKTAAFNSLVKTEESADENLSNILDVSKIIEFVSLMEKSRNYPTFAENITVERVYCQYNTPPTPAIDNNLSSALAKFIIPIVFEVFEDAK